MKKIYRTFNFVFCLTIVVSCSEIIFEKDISHEKVVLLAPANDTQFYASGISFDWQKISDATKYTLQIAKPNFSAPRQIVTDTILTITSFSQQLPVGNYEWRVKASNESYSTEFSSGTFSILGNSDFQSNIVSLTTPSNNLTANLMLQNLSWRSIIGAVSYQIQVYDSSNVIVTDHTTAETNYNYSFPEGAYWWRVRAYDGSDYTLYSSRSLLIDVTPPNAPSLTTPPNNASSGTNVTFEWNRVPISGSSERDTIYLYTNSLLTSLYAKNQVTSPYTVTLPVGTYYWKVAGSDVAGNSGNDSAVNKVIIN